MWQTKTFKSKPAYEAWLARAEGRYQIEPIFVNNGYGVTYRPLRLILFE